MSHLGSRWGPRAQKAPSCTHRAGRSHWVWEDPTGFGRHSGRLRPLKLSDSRTYRARSSTMLFKPLDVLSTALTSPSACRRRSTVFDRSCGPGEGPPMGEIMAGSSGKVALIPGVTGQDPRPLECHSRGPAVCRLGAARERRRYLGTYSRVRLSGGMQAGLAIRPGHVHCSRCMIARPITARCRARPTS